MKTITALQLLIAPSDIEPPAGYLCTAVGRLHVAFDASFLKADIRASSGARSGLIIGFPFDRRAGRFVDAQGLPDWFIADSIDDIERSILPDLAGSFLLVTHDPLPPRIYPDHAGSMPLVYGPEMGRAASSAAMLLDETQYQGRFDRELHQSLVLSEVPGGWISGTLTAHRGVQRLLPNHYLDVETWRAHRFWPQSVEIGSIGAEDAASVVSDALSAYCEASFRQFRTAATLTAGYDSRMLLASSRGANADAQFFTVGEQHRGNIDVDVAVRLSETFGLRHRVLPPIASSEEQKRIWDRAVGDCMIVENRDGYTTLGQLSEVDFILTGMYGEVGRCRLYRQDFQAINDMELSERFVIARLTLPQVNRLQENIGEWLAGLVGMPSSAILDLAFLELKFGSWAMGQRPAQNACKFALHPFAQRPIFEQFLALAPEEKAAGRLFDRCIGAMWLELGTIPINKYGDYRDRVAIAKKILNPSRLRRYLRDVFART